MYNLAKALLAEEAATGEAIVAIVVGKHDGADWNAKPLPDENIILSREAGLAKLDQDYNNGYGGADCFPFWAWTESRVYYVREYDGSTELSSVPRHPVGGEPGFS